MCGKSGDTDMGAPGCLSAFDVTVIGHGLALCDRENSTLTKRGLYTRPRPRRERRGSAPKSAPKIWNLSRKCAKCLILLVGDSGFEPLTPAV